MDQDMFLDPATFRLKLVLALQAIHAEMCKQTEQLAAISDALVSDRTPGQIEDLKGEIRGVWKAINDLASYHN